MSLFLLLAIAATSPHRPTDVDADGFPDAAELQRSADRENFRRWFVTVALSRYKDRQEEITDCAQLVRYSYREAMKSHDAGWREKFGTLVDPSIPEIEAFHYPDVPYIGTDIFRLADGEYEVGDREAGRLGNFADVPHLMKYHTLKVASELSAKVKEGDLLFFTPRDNQMHVMIFLELEGVPYLVYHTGPGSGSSAGGDEGEMRLIRLETLMKIDAESWRPVASNPAFAGFYRFKILD